MLYVLLAILAAFAYVLTRYYLLKKEIKNAVLQLQQLHQHESGKKLTISFYDRDFELLAKEINHQIDATKQAIAVKRSTENELRQAISHISHDIRTPMTSILGYIQLLESDEISDGTKKKHIETIKNSARRLKVLLEDFFELSIIEREDYPLKVEKVSMNHLMIESLLGYYDEFNKRNIKPDMHLPDQEIMIMTDPSLVKRVIENLAVNAIRYSTGNVSIQLCEKEGIIQLKISNSVENTSELEVHHMFDRFYKADQTRTGNGTGLGLSITKSLMEKMNGCIYAELEEQHLTMICEWHMK